MDGDRATVLAAVYLVALPAFHDAKNFDLAYYKCHNAHSRLFNECGFVLGNDDATFHFLITFSRLPRRNVLAININKKYNKTLI